MSEARLSRLKVQVDGWMFVQEGDSPSVGAEISTDPSVGSFRTTRPPSAGMWTNRSDGKTWGPVPCISTANVNLHHPGHGAGPVDSDTINHRPTLQFWKELTVVCVGCPLSFCHCGRLVSSERC